MKRLLPVLLVIVAPVLAQPVPLPPHHADAADAVPAVPSFPVPAAVPVAQERAPGFVPPLPPRHPGEPPAAGTPPVDASGTTTPDTTAAPVTAAPDVAPVETPPEAQPDTTAAPVTAAPDGTAPEPPPATQADVPAPAPETAPVETPADTAAAVPAVTPEEPAVETPPDTAAAASPDLAPARPKSAAEVRLDACIVDAQAQPADTLAAAQAWEDQGGGTFARRCAAAAKLADGKPGPAARDYEDLARELVILDPDTAITLYRKAGEAWLIAGEAMRAQGIATEGMKTAPDDPGLLLLRATAAMSLSDFSDARAALDRAIAANPKAPQLYVMRGTVEQRAGQATAAMTDAQLALLLDPRNVDALLLRGRLRLAAGDREGALSDWRTVVGVDGDGPAADDARAEIRMAGATP